MSTPQGSTGEGRPLRVRILGGGVAGLAAALALETRAGLTDIVVYEREGSPEEAHRTGHGLMLMQNGVQALRALGAEALLKSARGIDRALFQDAGGAVLKAERFDEVFCVTRAAIVEGLRARLRHTGIVYGRTCEAVSLGPNGLKSVRFREGGGLSSEDAELFIGAEGFRSPTWAALNPGAERPRSRVRELVTTTEWPELAARLGPTFVKTMLGDRGAACGLLAPTDTRVIGFLQFDAERWEPPGRDAQPYEIKAFFERVLAGAPEPVPTWLAGANLTAAHLWHPTNADLPPHAHGPNVVLIGDAFHPVLPFTSQGVSAALEDAIVLADAVHAVVRQPDLLPAALGGYATTRAHDVTAYIEGGRRILASFVDTAGSFTPTYLDGAVSRLEEHLGLSPGSLGALFRALDTDGNGALDRAELDRALDLFELDLSPSERVALMAHLDADGNGLVDTEELVAALGGTGETTELVRRVRDGLSPRKVELYTAEARSRQIFKLLDMDGDGQVDATELAAGLALLGLDAPPGKRNALMEALGGRGTFQPADLEAALQVPERPTLIGRMMERVGNPLESKEDPLFDHPRVNLPLLRERAFNFRWAEQPEGVIPLTAADPDLPVAEPIVEAIARYAQGGLFPYGPAEGLPDLRRVAAEWLRDRRAMPCTAAEVFVVNSAASALYLIAQIALDTPGAEALIPDPVDFLFERSVVAAGGSVRRFPLHRQGGRISFDIREIESMILPGRTRLLGICNPHNPLGRVWTRAELEALADLAIRHDLWILADEVWSDIVHRPNVFTAVASLGPEVARRTFTALGFSKSYGLAGLRLGLLVTPDAARLQQAVRISHADETAYGVSTLSQVAGIAALEHAGPWLERFVAHLTRQRDLAVQRLNAIPGVTCHLPEGTFVVFPDVSAITPDIDALVARLKSAHRVAVVPGSPRFFGPGAQGHIRLALATSRAILTTGLDRLEAGLRG